MAPEKTRAIILKILPYRESSYIVYLFTEMHGLVHSIAKGIRRQKRGISFLERGFLIENILYVRPNRDLHIMGNIQVLDFFPDIRSNLPKGAVRDAAFETILSAITVTDPHPELFDFFRKFLEALETSTVKESVPFSLWRFFMTFADMLGFRLNIRKCARCGKPIDDQISFLNFSKGGVECGACVRTVSESVRLRPEILNFLSDPSVESCSIKAALSQKEIKQATRTLSDYCRYHFDVRGEPKALDFLEGMV